MPLQCIIIEDEPIGRKILQDYIRQDSRLQLAGTYRTAAEAGPHVPALNPDLLFLDIRMPLLSGIEWLRSLPTPPLVIFTTAFREYAIEAFDLNAVDYLLKPFSFLRFAQAVQKALDRCSPAAGTTAGDLFLRDGVKWLRVSIDQILYIEAMREYVKVVTMEGAHLIHQSMKSMEEQLPADLFLRIHKSYIVAISRIRSVEGREALVGKQRLPISRQLKKEVLEKITRSGR
ncbi:MAG TPA: LytTR family DNA-binding domain-containing protein [Puia sp.]